MQVILKLYRNTKGLRELLGEFRIDLDALKQKNVQYFPFDIDYVLQVNLYFPNKANSRSSRIDDYGQNYTRNSRLNSQI